MALGLSPRHGVRRGPEQALGRLGQDATACGVRDWADARVERSAGLRAHNAFSIRSSGTSIPERVGEVKRSTT